MTQLQNGSHNGARNGAAAAYRRVELDALVLGSSGPALVHLCLGEAIAALDRAASPIAGSQRSIRSAALCRVLLALSALRAGVDAAKPIGPALLEIYAAASDAVTAATLQYRAEPLARVRQDLCDLRDAIPRSSAP
ncbi:flagellar protein FliS [Alteripontixanthobacter maritimus]|nr:flagellar protein FliS [Alteripontixanthobacter maritimus]